MDATARVTRAWRSIRSRSVFGLMIPARKIPFSHSTLEYATGMRPGAWNLGLFVPAESGYAVSGGTSVFRNSKGCRCKSPAYNRPDVALTGRRVSFTLGKTQGTANEHRNPRYGFRSSNPKTDSSNRCRQRRGNVTPPSGHAGRTGSLAPGKPQRNQRENTARHRAARPRRGNPGRPIGRLLS